MSVCWRRRPPIGAHALSGAVMEPGPLDALLPRVAAVAARDLRTREPRRIPAADPYRQLAAAAAAAAAQPRQLHHLARPADAMAGAEGRGTRVSTCFPAFAAAAPLINATASVAGVQLGDMGIEKNGEPGPNYTPGAEIRARTTIIAEGARGSLAKQLIRRFGLDARSLPAVLRPGIEGAVAAARKDASSPG